MLKRMGGMRPEFCIAIRSLFPSVFFSFSLMDDQGVFVFYYIPYFIFILLVYFYLEYFGGVFVCKINFNVDI